MQTPTPHAIRRHAPLRRVAGNTVLQSTRHTPCAVAQDANGTRSVPATLGRPSPAAPHAIGRHAADTIGRHAHSWTARLGITLIETVIAISLTTFVAGALLTALSSSVQVGADGLHAAVANGLADQLMDEIASVKFPSSSTTGSTAGAGRTAFDDVDDYSGYSVSPPQARSGSVIGTEATATSGKAMTRPQEFQPDPRILARYRQQVTVEKIAEATGTSWVTTTQATPLRRVTVTISYTDAQGKTTPLAVQVRVFSNVAVAP